jgi:predicted PurR-regulated permease PerM
VSARVAAGIWAVSGLALGLLLGLVLPALLMPLVVGAVAALFGERLEAALDPVRDWGVARSVAVMAGYGAAVGIFVVIGTAIGAAGGTR